MVFYGFDVQFLSFCLPFPYILDIEFVMTEVLTIN